MKDSHLTLRLPADLARALARKARMQGVAKSQLAREAVARYLAGAGSPPAPGRGTRGLTSRELAARWASVPTLSPEEVDAFAADIARARAELPSPHGAWE